MKKETLEASYPYHICNNKTIKIFPNQLADFLRFFLQGVCWKLRSAWNCYSGKIFHIIFRKKKFSFAILHKLAKFHYQDCLLPSVNCLPCFMFRYGVSCLGIWWCHNIWISEKLSWIISRMKITFKVKWTFIFLRFASTVI